MLQKNKTFIIVLAFLCGSIILYILSGKQNHNIVTAATVPTNMQCGKSIKLLNIYASWCGWSKKLLPEWEQVEDYFNGNNNVVVEKHEESDSKELIKKLGIQGFPTIFKIKNDKMYEYPSNLPREAKYIIKWVVE